MNYAEANGTTVICVPIPLELNVYMTVLERVITTEFCEEQTVFWIERKAAEFICGYVGPPLYSVLILQEPNFKVTRRIFQNSSHFKGIKWRD